MGGRFSGDLWSAINTSVPTDEGVEQLGEGPSRGIQPQASVVLHSVFLTLVLILLQLGTVLPGIKTVLVSFLCIPKAVLCQ